MRLPIIRIDSRALIHNYHVMRRLSSPARCGAVVKANGYGIGLDIAAHRLKKAGCDLFYVASLDEGIALRQYLPNVDIAVFHGYRQNDTPWYQRHHLIPVLKTQTDGVYWSQHANTSPCVIEWDTGMHRGGITEPTTLDMNIHHMMTHMACADDPNHPLNRQQKARFDTIRMNDPDIPASMAASYGVLANSDYHYDITRVGIALYGGIDHHQLQPVVTIHAPILEMRTIQPGESVGYGASWRATQPCVIVTVGLGYADGYPRALSNTGTATIDGHRVPVVGRVSMDVITLDATQVPESVLRDAQSAVFYGDDLIKAARDAGTIPYELLTNLKPHLTRWVDDEHVSTTLCQPSLRDLT